MAKIYFFLTHFYNPKDTPHGGRWLAVAESFAAPSRQMCAAARSGSGAGLT